MTVQEALERFKALAQDERGDLCKVAVEALEKQIPKKATSKTDKLFGDISICCPNCENTGIVNPWSRKHYFKYCPDCGQALDWSEEE